MEGKEGLLGTRPKSSGLLGSHPKPIRHKGSSNHNEIYPSSSQRGRNRFGLPKQPLLPHPVLKICPDANHQRKKPLLRTPPISDLQECVHHQPLLKTPQYPPNKTLVSSREKQPSTWKSEPKILRDETYHEHKHCKMFSKQKHDNARSIVKKGLPVQDHRSNEHNTESEKDAYQLHLEKLQRSKVTQRSISPHEADNSKKNDLMVVENKDEPGDLSCLASYLLQMKSFSSKCEVEDRSGEEVSCDDIKLPATGRNDKDKQSNEVQHNLVYGNHHERKSLKHPSIDTVTEVNIEVKNVATEAMTEKRDSKTANEEILTLIDKTSAPSCDPEIKREMTEVVSKTKKHKIQLSNYANGNTDGDDGCKVKRKRLNSSEELLQLNVTKPIVRMTSSVCDSKDFIGEVVLPVSNAEENQVSVEHKPDEKPFVLLKDPLSEKGASVAELEPVFSRDPCNSTALLEKRSSHLETQVDKKMVAAKLPTNQPSPSQEGIKKESNNSGIEDLPHIIHVSGYFCDLCCDFFFDEESTFQHCNSIDHTMKVNAENKVKNPHKSSQQASSSLNCDDEKTVVRKQRKEKPATVQNELKSPFLHPRITPNKNARKSTRPGNALAAKRKKPFEWNFVIPKRK